MDIQTSTRIVYGGLFASIAGICVLLGQRKNITGWCKRFESSDVTLAMLEFIFAILGTAFATHFKVWETDFSNHPIRTPGNLAFVFDCGFLAFYCKWLRDRVKDRAKEKVAALEAELEKKTLLLARHRRLGAQIRGLVDRKIRRIREATRKITPSMEDLLVPQARETQVHTILQAIHDFFFFELQQQRPEAKMRLALYLPDDTPKLECFYSWNGKEAECVHASDESMMLMSPQGIRSEIVRTYHKGGNHCLTLIPKCGSDPDFAWFHQDQKEYLKSMLAFKYQVQQDGADAALVLSLDCDEPNFFSTDRYEEISEFLVEMLKRFEYEMLGLQIVTKLQHEIKSP